MKIFRLLATLLLVALCTGQTSCSSKVYTPDVNVKEVNSKQYIYNGAIAIETTTTGANFNRTFYDENGNIIEEREFEKKYRDLWKSLKHKLPID